MSDWIPTFQPASAPADSIATLLYLTLGVCTLIFLVVAFLVTFALVRYRARPFEGEDGRPHQGHAWLEVVWTLIPVVIVAGLFVLTVRVMRTVDPAPPAGRTPDLEITGHQWWWEVRYPRAGVVTANEIHIPAGQRLLVRVTSDDVVHDVWIPRLGRKIDLIPGHPNHLWLEARDPGLYRGSCAEFCGPQHAHMRILVIAETPEAFHVWLAHQARPGVAPTTPEERRGATLFQARTCASCHAIAGSPAAAGVGPDLTHLASRSTLAAGTLENTPESLSRWLADPDAVKPGSHMPDLELPPTDLRALVAYLESLR